MMPSMARVRTLRRLNGVDKVDSVDLVDKTGVDEKRELHRNHLPEKTCYSSLSK